MVNNPLAQKGVRVCHLTKRYGSVLALNGIDLDVVRGEVVALLGQNGAGKSTLLRILATSVLPDSGTVHVGGFDVISQAVSVRRIIGLGLGDERSWYWRISGRQNLEFFAALYGLGRRAAAARSVRLLQEMDLEQVADRRFDRYSAGMRARLSLARALLPAPSVLLLDEPTRSLDPIAAASFRVIISELGHRRDVAVVFVTHDLYEAAAVADRVIVLAGGQIAAVAPRGADAAVLERALIASAD